MPPKTAPPLSVAWFVWSLGALFYLMAFFQRVAPAVMTAELMRDFQINAAALGNLSAFYFYSYVAMQIPTGIIADVWGPRRLLSLGAFVDIVQNCLVCTFKPNDQQATTSSFEQFHAFQIEIHPGITPESNWILVPNQFFTDFM